MLRIVTWNMRRAKSSSKCWDLLSEIAPDLALLQEVGEFPSRIRAEYEVAEEIPTNRSGQPQRFKTALLARGRIKSDIDLVSGLDWVNQERVWFRGNILARTVSLGNGDTVNVVSLYSPAWPVAPARLVGIDVRGVKLEQNPDVWCTEILWSLLKSSMSRQPGPWVIGGDFNSSETFDAWRVGGRGNAEIVRRLNDLGLTECLRAHQGRLVPTFRNPRGGGIVHQIDHLYVSETLLDQMLVCNAPMEDRIFAEGLSDHLPIVADFKTT
jgi:endonuclease/exonuclease/phosphatase family metal-dependent hydrolase